MSIVHPPPDFSLPPRPSAASFYGVIDDIDPSSRCCGCRRARDVVDTGELVMLWMPARAHGSPPILTAPRTTHVTFHLRSRRRWPPRSSAMGRAYVQL
ncbi:hypothetical protein TIFTF001_006567 [Ficus carica]|uniref:Uncharacterized protein n=1 Tax=Ficus carica TaxID=3494 RepID=A0AA88A4F7_FICCA|nr:hypothetical protein TIFTF001_006567 [Ficus carica]